MSIFFGRACSLQIFNVTRVPNQRATIIDSIEIKGLRIRFKVEKSLESIPNNAVIEIYNLSESTLTFLEKRGSAVVLRAGYADDPGDTQHLHQLFIGDVAKVSTEQKGADWITRIEAGDGEWAFQNQSAEVAFAPGINAGQILDKLTDLFGLTKGPVPGINRSDVFVNGYSSAGMLRKHIQKLAKRQNVEWSIQDGALQIIPFDKPLPGEIFVLSPFSGLIAAPFRQVVLRPDLIKSSGGGDNFKIEGGSKIQALLNPELRSGGVVKVDSKRIVHLFRIQKITHDGDTWGKNWYSDIEGKLL